MPSLESTVHKLDENLLKDRSELGEVMENLDDDKTDAENKMSRIDFNARLTSEEISAILILDEMIRLGIMNKRIGLARQKKRLSVSKNGLGRTEKVQIVSSERDRKSGIGFGEKFTNLFRKHV